MSKALPLALILIGVLFSIVGCNPNQEISTVADINGHYLYEETVYMSPISSYYATKEIADDYLITPTALTVLHKDGTEQQIPAGLEKSEVDVKAFESPFKIEINVPEINKYKQCYEYRINDNYRLYTMDGEVWIAQLVQNDIRGIHRLVKVD